MSAPASGVRMRVGEGARARGPGQVFIGGVTHHIALGWGGEGKKKSL